MERSLYWYTGRLHILTFTYTAALTIKQNRRQVLSRPPLMEQFRLSQIEDDFHKKLSEEKQVLKENQYQ